MSADDQSLGYQVHTFGCKVNSYDSGLIQDRMNQSGFVGDSKSKVHIFNTCAVTAEASREAARQIRRLKSKDPFATVVVTGCAAQVDTGMFEKLPGADLVVANSHKSRIPELIRDHFAGTLSERVFKSNIFRKEELGVGGGLEKDHTRSFLKIQDGCNSFCTYCVIPFGRGKSRSISISDIVQRVRELEMQGVKEVVLTGVHIGDYEDGEERLEDLVEAVLLRTKIPRVRMTSLEPVEVSHRLLDLYSDDRMCRHFHMSIQSATTSVLKKMKRNYTAFDVENSLWRIAEKVPGSFVGMDVIVGFPQESGEDFEETYKRLEGLPWTRIHVFPYSSRPGTKAERMEGHLPPAVIKERSKRLRELSSDRFARAGLAQIGERKRVLVLGKGALSRDYWNVQLSSGELSGEVDVEITGYDHSDRSRMDGILIGRPIN